MKHKFNAMPPDVAPGSAEEHQYLRALREERLATDIARQAFRQDGLKKAETKHGGFVPPSAAQSVQAEVINVFDQSTSSELVDVKREKS